MAYQEENDLYNDSFSKAICSIAAMPDGGESDENTLHGEHTIFIQSSGMFEMAAHLDAVNGSLAGKLYDAIGPMDGYNFKIMQNKMRLLHDRNKYDLEHNKKSF